MGQHSHQRAVGGSVGHETGSGLGTREIPLTSMGRTENTGKTLIVRRYPRVAVQLPVSFRNNECEADGTLYNLSLGGCRIDTDQPPEKGVYLLMHMYLSYAEPPTIIQLAAVRWSSATEFGVEFLMLTEATQERLQRFLRTV